MAEKSKHRNRSLRIVALILVLLVAGGTVYVSDFYHTDPAAAALLDEDIPGITITVGEDRIVFQPEEAKAGLIFYPGGKVEFTAYAPLMRAFADRGFLCVLLKMPLNLAVLGVNAADRVLGAYPEISDWYIAGHSLGGAMAASYAGKHSEALTGLILLAAYSTADLKESSLQVLSLYGSEDGVLNMQKYEKNRSNLPADAVEVIIPGGCHAYFGSYGAQKGDGNPSVSREEQISFTAEKAAGLLTE